MWLSEGLFSFFWVLWDHQPHVLIPKLCSDRFSEEISLGWAPAAHFSKSEAAVQYGVFTFLVTENTSSLSDFLIWPREIVSSLFSFEKSLLKFLFYNRKG